MKKFFEVNNKIREIVYMVILFGVAMAQLAACQKTKDVNKPVALISSGKTIVSVADYNKALEIAKTAYSHNELRDPDTYRIIQTRVLKQLSEDIVLLEIAEEKNISISKAEVDKAVSDVKKDYPEGEFKEALLESAISFSDWRESIKRRLLLEKVVSEVWGHNIEITPSEMTEYYEKHYIKDGMEDEFDKNPEKVYSNLMKRLKREKTEEAYQKWINEKKDHYSIEVNKKVWEKIIGINSLKK